MPKEDTKKTGKTSDRCPSGIPGFDKISQGGFVRNSVNTLVGGPGSGKSLFLMQFLHEGATKYNENGLYISFENEVNEIFKDAEKMGWDFNLLDMKNKCKFMRISPLTSTYSLKKELQKVVQQYKIRRICLDPVTLFGNGEKDEIRLRIALFEITSQLKKMDVTVILASELTSIESDTITEADQKTHYIKFLVDGVVEMYSSGLGGITDRAVRIVKMRRTNHTRGPVPLKITDNGLEILADKKKNSF